LPGNFLIGRGGNIGRSTVHHGATEQKAAEGKDILSWKEGFCGENQTDEISAHKMCGFELGLSVEMNDAPVSMHFRTLTVVGSRSNNHNSTPWD
jgi:hypothetical protein